LAQAIIIDLHDTLTDESNNEKEALTLVRQIVATAGVRVTEQAFAAAQQFAIDSFAPNHWEAMIFKLVSRDTTLGLRCSGAFKKNFKRKIKVRPEGEAIIAACKQRGWKLALAHAPSKEEEEALKEKGLLDQFDVKGPPAAMKIQLPDMRVLEFLLGSLGIVPADCIMLGNRVDNDIRPANNLRMTTIQLQVGIHGKKQFARDLKDVPDYEAPNLEALMHVIPSVV
jgi:FMN phosphatase YigB (HAD superfamily)